MHLSITSITALDTWIPKPRSTKVSAAQEGYAPSLLVLSVLSAHSHALHALTLCTPRTNWARWTRGGRARQIHYFNYSFGYQGQPRSVQRRRDSPIYYHQVVNAPSLLVFIGVYRYSFMHFSARPEACILSLSHLISTDQH